MGIIYTIYPTNLSIVIGQKGLGGSGATGLVNAIGTAGGFIAGFGLKYLNKVFKDRIISAGFFLLALTFLLVRLANNIVLAGLGGIASGFAMAMIMSTIPYYISLVSKDDELSVGMMIFQFMNSVGGFISPLILKMFNVKAGEISFVIGCIAATSMAIICLIFNTNKNLKRQ